MADVNALAEEYKRLIMNLVDNAQAVANTLPQRVEEAKNTVLSYAPNADTANNLANTIRGYVEDMSPPGDSPDLYKNLLINYLWVAVCLFVAALVDMTLGKVYVPIVGTLFGSGLIFMVTCLVLPYLIAQYLPVKMEGSEDDKRMYMLVACVVDYVTFTVLLGGAFVPFNAPPSFLLPLLMGVLSDALGPSLGAQPRTVFLGAVLGAPAAASFVYGMMTGSLTGMYFVWLLAQLAVALVDIQMKISAFKGGKTADCASQGFSLICFLYVTFLMTLLSSGHEEKSSESSSH